MNVILKKIQPEHLVIGAIFREVYSDGSSPQFCDSILVSEAAGIYFFMRPMVQMFPDQLPKMRSEEYNITYSRLLSDDCILKTVCRPNGIPASSFYNIG